MTNETRGRKKGLGWCKCVGGAVVAPLFIFAGFIALYGSNILASFHSWGSLLTAGFIDVRPSPCR
jgi:hypothetical protein